MLLNHQKQKYHQDFKLDNLCVTATGDVMVLDLGMLPAGAGAVVVLVVVLVVVSEWGV